MCVVSMVMDHYYEKWRDFPTVPVPVYPPGWYPLVPVVPNPLSQEEVNDLWKMLQRAREYDVKNGEPECELESKKQKLKDLAKKLGVEIDFL